jgi:hypothetical protein
MFAILLGLAILFGVPQCPTDETTPGTVCYWNAHTQGDGKGSSYIWLDGTLIQEG